MLDDRVDDDEPEGLVYERTVKGTESELAVFISDPNKVRQAAGHADDADGEPAVVGARNGLARRGWAY